MEIVYSPKAQDDINFWKKQGNKTIQSKISTLLNAVLENPYKGIGLQKIISNFVSWNNLLG